MKKVANNYHKIPSSEFDLLSTAELESVRPPSVVPTRRSAGRAHPQNARGKLPGRRQFRCSDQPAPCAGVPDPTDSIGHHAKFL